MAFGNATIVGLLAALAAACVIVGCGGARARDATAHSPARDAERSLVLLHTNDLHGHVEAWTGWEGELAGKTVGGFDRIASVVRRTREERGTENVLLLDAGDAVGDTMAASLTKGRAVVDLMNAVGYDAMAVGNHEPDFGPGGLAELRRAARFPLLAANLDGPAGEKTIVPYVIKEAGGVKVGVLGLAYPNTPLTTAAKNIEGFTYRKDSAAVVMEQLPKIRAGGAELIVVLSHLGLGADLKLAEQAEGIDVIVGGHSHNRMHEATQVGRTLIVQAGAHGSDVGRLDLIVKDGRVLSHRRELVTLDHERVPSDKETAALLSETLAPHRRALDERVGVAATPIVRAQTLAGQAPRKRDVQSPADSLFADVLRETTKSDVALLPGVGYGVAIPAGPITASALRNLIPHESKVVTMTLSGAEIRSVLEQSVENTYTGDVTNKVGGIIQVSGLSFAYDPDAAPGARVDRVVVGDREIEVERRYTAATNSMLASGGHNYRAFIGGRDRRERGGQYEMVVGALGSGEPVSAPSDRRIIRTDPVTTTQSGAR